MPKIKEDDAHRAEVCAPSGIRALLGDPETLPANLETALCNAMRSASEDTVETARVSAETRKRTLSEKRHTSCDGGLPMEPTTLPLLLTYTAVAEQLGYSNTCSVADLVRAGELQVVGKGRGRRVPRESLLAYVERLCRGEQ